MVFEPTAGRFNNKTTSDLNIFFYFFITNFLVRLIATTKLHLNNMDPFHYCVGSCCNLCFWEKHKRGSLKKTPWTFCFSVTKLKQTNKQTKNPGWELSQTCPEGWPGSSYPFHCWPVTPTIHFSSLITYEWVSRECVHICAVSSAFLFLKNPYEFFYYIKVFGIVFINYSNMLCISGS